MSLKGVMREPRGWIVTGIPGIPGSGITDILG
jgi:hypothetical protein